MREISCSEHDKVFSVKQMLVNKTVQEAAFKSGSLRIDKHNVAPCSLVEGR